MSHSESFIESVTRWTTDSVKAELRNNKLSQAGNKNQLVTRLQQLYRRQAVSGQPINNQTPIPNPATSSTGIQQTANSNQIQHGARDTMTSLIMTYRKTPLVPQDLVLYRIYQLTTAPQISVRTKAEEITTNN